MPVNKISKMQTRKVSRIAYRSLSPKSLDEEARSVEFIASTENPVSVFDWNSWGAIDEILLMSGCNLPKSGTVPFLDSHSRYSIKDVVGSFKDFRMENGELLGRAYFSTVQEAEKAFTLVREGHLTDVSVGYEINEYHTVKEDEVYEHEGSKYIGPLRLVTSWELFEVSLCPIGADPNAKARNKNMNETEEIMPKRENSNLDDDDLKKTENSAEKRADADDVNEDDNAKTTNTGDKRENSNLDDDDDDKTDGVEPKTQAEATSKTGDDSDENDDDDDSDEKKVDASTRSQIAKRERVRCLDISGICKAFSMDDAFEKRCISKGLSINSVRAAVLERLEGRDMAGYKIEMGTSEGEKVREAASQGFMLRCGISEKSINGGKLAGDANHFRGMTMKEMARDLLVRSGVQVPHDVRDMVARALTTTDLPVILSQGMQRVLLTEWEAYKGTWDTWCGQGEVNDFRPQTLASFGLGQTLDLIHEGGEYKYGKAAEHKETVQIATYGKLLTITRQAIINDDLSVFTSLPRLHGQAAARTINQLAYDVLRKNVKMGDEINLFHADHRNLIVGGGIPDVTKVGAITTMMKSQRDLAHNSIQVNPIFFIAPVALETASEVFFSSHLIGSQAQPNQNNIYAGTRFTRVYDALLDEGDSNSWYLAAAKGSNINLYFLNGNSAPRLEEKEGWSRDGVEFKVSIDAAAKASAWQTIAKSHAK